MPAPHPLFQLKMGIHSEREASIVHIVDLAYSSDSRSSSGIFKNKEKQTKNHEVYEYL